jgi:hypothetical protein
MTRFFRLPRGVSNLQEAWFLGTTYNYFGIPLRSIGPVSDKGTLLILGNFACCCIPYYFYLEEMVSMLQCVLLSLPIWLTHSLVMRSKTYWMSKEEAEDLFRRAK